MYIINLNYTKPVEEVYLFLEVHKDFIDKYYEKKNFLISGPKIPGTGGIIICNAANIDEVNDIINEDPFIINHVAEYEIIEFSPTNFANGLESLLQLD